jgi:hypothetical protein
MYLYFKRSLILATVNTNKKIILTPINIKEDVVIKRSPTPININEDVVITGVMRSLNT